MLDNKTIMIQGTASDVGKSLITTAFCRIFSRQNFKVAPFKSWNMSLNSFVTPDGGEIGIAQALQAAAAGIKPTVDMQPILVKPRGEGSSQIILRGKPIGNIDNRKKASYLKRALTNIKKSLNKLRQKNDIVVMEGAGSPVEINVKKWDLANMKVAKMFNSPVIVVADIDRGGALASLVGTVSLMEPEERKLVQGFIINRFRGDIDLLKSGIEFLEEYTQIPVLGVIPYFKNINLPKEDSASLSRGNSKSDSTSTDKDIKIGVINLPHLSNFTDFLPLASEKDVNLIYINQVKQMKNLDLIILPGSKSTTGDLKYLKDKGFADKIKELSKKKIPVLGICAGYQMMGEMLSDPYHTEGETERIKGLGILPVATRFLPEKTTHQIKAKITGQASLLRGIEGEEIEGYEIHMGNSNNIHLESINNKENNKLFTICSRSGEKTNINDGIVAADGLHFGTYIHGLFNNDNLRKQFLENIRQLKGLSPIDRNYTFNQGLTADYDKLADVVVDNMYWEKLKNNNTLDKIFARF